MNETGIPASVILGISILESGSGTSYLSKNKNNYFGIKRGKYYRGYESDTASFNHFCEFISSKKFYNSIKENRDYRIWINNINKIGYSTSSTWGGKVITIIKRYNLHEYDQ